MKSSLLPLLRGAIEWRIAVTNLGPTQEQVDLLVAADQRRGGRAQSVESPLGRACAQHLPGRHILREAFKRDGAEIAIVEQATC